MKRSLALVCLGLLAQGLSAETAGSLSGTVAVALPVSATAVPGSVSPTAVSEATPAPTPSPTPTPFVAMKGPSSLVRLIDPSWAVAFKAGAALPLGDLAQFNLAGPAVHLDLYYHAGADYSVDSFINYTSQAYKLGGGVQPLTNIGLGSKLLYNLAEIDAVTWYVGGGVALYYDQRTKQVLRPVVSNAKPIFDPEADSSFGIGALAVVGGRYQDPAGWGVVLELNFATINLAGGTSETLYLAQPLLGFCYTL